MCQAAGLQMLGTLKELFATLIGVVGQLPPNLSEAGMYANLTSSFRNGVGQVSRVRLTSRFLTVKHEGE